MVILLKRLGDTKETKSQSRDGNGKNGREIVPKGKKGKTEKERKWEKVTKRKKKGETVRKGEKGKHA